MPNEIPETKSVHKHSMVITQNKPV